MLLLSVSIFLQTICHASFHGSHARLSVEALPLLRLFHVCVAVNCIYWEKQFPRLLSTQQLRDLAQKGCPLVGISDLTCDMEGSIEILNQTTTIDSSFFRYNDGRLESFSIIPHIKFIIFLHSATLKLPLLEYRNIRLIILINLCFQI